MRSGPIGRWPAAARKRRFVVRCASLALVAAALGAAGAVEAAGAASTSGTEARTAADVTATFTIDPSTGQVPISPLIYGINDDATSYQNTYAADVAAALPTVVRLGGDRWTAYNWENNYSNAGADYCFENDDYLDASTSPGDAVKATIENDTAAGASTIVTIPIAGYVSADGNNAPQADPTVDPDCPQDVRNSGPSYLSTRFDQDEPIGPVTDVPDTSDGYVYQNQFVDWLKLHEPDAKLIFSLDNEPDFWSGTHPEVHPATTGYQELVNDDLAYAKAVKSVLPDAEITGPVLGGFDGQVNLLNSSDYSTFGNFTAYWLKAVAAADQQAGETLISDYDIHWYPQISDVFSNDTSPSVVADREQAPRSLWDPTYVEPSYIPPSYLGNGPITLIPRIEAEIAANNPGMNLDISEWDYGASDDISGAIADADALGIFGREGVHLATFWPQSENDFAYGALSIFRDYDGSGATFGDTEVDASTSDVADTSVYASIDHDQQSHLVIVAINKNTVATDTTIDLQHADSYGRAAVYTLTAAGGPTPQPAPTLNAGGYDSYQYEMPAQSISVIVPALVPASTGPPPLSGPTSTSTDQGVELSLRLSGRVSTHAGEVTFRLACAPGAHCTSISTLIARETKPTHRTILVGSRTVTVDAGKTVAVAVKLDGAGRKLLAKFGRLPIVLTIALSAEGERTILAVRKLTVSAKQKRR
jgi:hypothetical protein